MALEHYEIEASCEVALAQLPYEALIESVSIRLSYLTNSLCLIRGNALVRPSTSILAVSSYSNLKVLR